MNPSTAMAAAGTKRAKFPSAGISPMKGAFTVCTLLGDASSIRVRLATSGSTGLRVRGVVVAGGCSEASSCGLNSSDTLDDSDSEGERASVVVAGDTTRKAAVGALNKRATAAERGRMNDRICVMVDVV
eukprot:scaffold6263_cov192-Alexandrium_tamarense.AAC.12